MTALDAADGPPALHQLEREVMERVWRRGEATVRQVLDDLNEHADRERAYTTVLTVMVLLYRKGLLTRRRDRKTHIYMPAMPRNEYLQSRARAQVSALVAEYGDVALVHFAREIARLGPAKRAELGRRARPG